MPKIWRRISFGWAGFIALFSLLPAEAAVSSGFGDKIEHFGAFAVLAAAARFGWAHEVWWRLSIVLLASGAGIELAQFLSPGRHPDGLDWTADAVGVIAGLMLGHIVRQRLT